MAIEISERKEYNVRITRLGFLSQITQICDKIERETRLAETNPCTKYEIPIYGKPVTACILFEQKKAGNLLLPVFTLDDVDDGVVKCFKKWAVKKGRIDKSTLDETKETLMKKLHLMNNGYLTNAAMLLFAEDPKTWQLGGTVNGTVNGTANLTGDERRILELLAEDPPYTYQDIASRFE